MDNQWTKLSVKCKTEDLDQVCAVVGMLDNGLMIEDFSDFSFNGMYGELVDEKILEADKTSATVSIFVPAEKNVMEYRAYLVDRFNFLNISVSYDLSGVCEDDWAENWKKYYKPVPLGKVTIVPAWENYEAKPGEVVVKMDPGMAFGTGTHETTRLVLRLMQDECLEGKTVLDVGTGSGILSIAASKLGAEKINAYDIDPTAVRVAKENAEREGCYNVSVGVSDLLLGVDKSVKYEFCVANIVADIIIRMMPDLSDYLTKDAPVILSGIIASRSDEVRECCRQCGYEIVKEISENDWIGLLISKK